VGNSGEPRALKMLAGLMSRVDNLRVRIKGHRDRCGEFELLNGIDPRQI
jgi:hypothetical protein